MGDVNTRNAPDSWERFVAGHGVGDELEGRIRAVVGFGAFVEVAPGIEGLLHESEYQEAPSLGAAVVVRIDGIDSGMRRMSLALA